MREMKYGPNMKVVTTVKKGCAAQSNIIQPQMPLRSVDFGCSLLFCMREKLGMDSPFHRSRLGSPVARGGTSAISSVPAKMAPIAGNTERATVAIDFLNMAEAK